MHPSPIQVVTLDVPPHFGAMYTYRNMRKIKNAQSGAIWKWKVDMPQPQNADKQLSLIQ